MSQQPPPPTYKPYGRSPGPRRSPSPSRSPLPPPHDQQPPQQPPPPRFEQHDDDMMNNGGYGHYNDRYRSYNSHHRPYNTHSGYRPYKKFNSGGFNTRHYPSTQYNRHHQPQHYNNYRPGLKKHYPPNISGNSPPHHGIPPQPLPPSQMSPHHSHSIGSPISAPPPPPPQQPLTPIKTQNQFQSSPFGRSPMPPQQQSPLFPPHHHFNQYNSNSTPNTPIYSTPQDSGYSSPSQANQPVPKYNEALPPPVEEDPQLTHQRQIVVEQQKKLKEALSFGPEFVIDETYNQEMYDTLVEVNKLREVQYTCQRQYNSIVNSCVAVDARVFHATTEFEQAKAEDEFYERLIQKYKDELANLTNKHQQAAAQQSIEENN